MNNIHSSACGSRPVSRDGSGSELPSPRVEGGIPNNDMNQNRRNTESPAAIPQGNEQKKRRDPIHTHAPGIADNRRETLRLDGADGQSRTTSEVSQFHVQANANCYAVADLVVTAKDERQARKKAQQIFDRTSFQVAGNTRTGAKVFVDLMPENVEIEILEVEDHEGELAPVEEPAVRSRVEAEIGRLILLEMESMEINDANKENIRAGMCNAMVHDLFHQLWPLYVELHPNQATSGPPAVNSPA